MSTPPSAGERLVASSSVQRWLLALALLYTLYFARSLLIPLVLALLAASVLTPLVNTLYRRHIPRSISAVLLVTCICAPLALLGLQLAEPAQKWIQRAPELGLQVSEQLDAFTESITGAQHTGQAAPARGDGDAGESEEKGGFNFFGWFDDDDEATEKVTEAPATAQQDPVKARLVQGGIEAAIAVLSAAPLLLVQLLTVIILVLFQLMFGARLFDNAMSLVPRLRDRRRITLAVARVQRELSRYIVTVSLINTGLGIATAVVLMSLGVEDALLWGAMVGLLNFAPYVGPLVSVCSLSIAGIVQFGFAWAALVPALAYFLVNLAEAQFVTPLVLGRHMRLNPLLLVLWIIVWAWLWGAAGVLLAVPLLVSLKLLAQQFGVLTYWVELIETKS